MKKSKKEVQPNWHPNFRIQSELPDIKPIRTGFIINFVAVAICASLAVILVQQEFKRINLSGSINILGGIVEQSRAANSAALRDSREFANNVKPLQEIERFYDAPLVIYEFLTQLAEIRPEDVIYDNINFTETTRMERRTPVTSYRLQINGKSRSLGILGEFKGAMENMEFVRANDGRVNETILPRDDATGVFPFTVMVELTP